MARPSDEMRLADGSPPATSEELFRRLQSLGIEALTVQHPPVFTVDEAKKLRGQIAGCHTKNLFLRNKKGAMWLVVCLEDRQVDLKQLAELLGAGRLSFGSAERLMKYLGVIPGAVTPFGVINDKGGAVRVVLEREILAAGPLNFHPLDNAMTTSIDVDGMLRFLEAEGHPAEFIELR
jgi:Ala-tRNA(Pro) deacylase